MQRFRHLANPLHNIPEVAPLQISKVFSKKQPLVLEIGFGFGKFFIGMAQKYPAKNFIGLETRKPLVSLLASQLANLRLTNTHVFYANANFGLTTIFKSARAQEVFILFPDPWIKRRHIKRRLVNQVFIKTLHKICKKGATIYIKTDEKFLYADILQHFLTAKSPQGKTLFKKIRNPKLPVLTNREEKYLQRGKKIWQLTYAKN